MADSETSLPIIDMTQAQDPKQRAQVASQVVQALETVGFLFLDNVAGFDADRLQENASWFFSLTPKHKRDVSRKLWNPESQNHYRGYFPLQPGEVSYKEGFEIGLEPLENNINPTSNSTHPSPLHPFFQEPNVWPKGVPGSEKFHSEMLAHSRAMVHCGTEILRLVSLGCGLQENWFESLFFPGSLSTLRLLHYPPRYGEGGEIKGEGERGGGGAVPQAAYDGDVTLCCSQHSDSGFVTLLATFNYGGLQIRKEGKEGWMDVPCRPYSLVMNIGDMLSVMSGGRFKATCHRVVDTNTDRFSVPFFFEPNYYADISKAMPTPLQTSRPTIQPSADESTNDQKETQYGPWLIEKMRTFAEYREILNAFTSPAES